MKRTPKGTRILFCGRGPNIYFLAYCCRILHCDRKISALRWFNNQEDCIFLFSCVYLRSVSITIPSISLSNYHNQSPSPIHLIQLQDIRSIYYYYNRSTHLNYVNPRIQLYNTYLSFNRIIQLFSFCMT